MSTPSRQTPITVAYKHIGPDGANPISLDLYMPPVSSTSKDVLTLPTVIYFHAGGMSVGNKGWFPSWLYNRVLSLGYAFVSANYQLMPPASGHEIVQDIQDLFTFLAKTEITVPNGTFKADVNRLAVAGSSSGGHCAYLAAVHCTPKPKAVLGMYSPAGNLFCSQYLHEKKEKFFMDRDLLDTSRFPQFIYPFTGGSTTPISDSPIVFDPVTKLPNNIRVTIPPLYLQLGTFLDYYTGQHEPSLSASLRAVLDSNPNATLDDFKRVIPVSQRYLFPELNVTSSWPPTVLFHGDSDTAVLPAESRHLFEMLKKVGVTVTLLEARGQDHLFDMPPTAEEQWGKQFDGIKNFFFKNLGTV